MASRKKTVLKGFNYRNCDDFAAYLNHMARQGWHFKEWRAGLVFEQGEPENAVYAVEVFNKAEESDTHPLPETREFAEYCEAAGWQFVDAWRKFVVFKRVREDAVPIMTDEERFENIVKAEKSRGWYPLIHAALWFCMQLTQFNSLFPYRIFSKFHLIMMATWTVLFFATALHAVHFVLWKRQCRQRMERGLSLFFGRNQADTWQGVLYGLVLVVLSISMYTVGQPLYAATFAIVTVAIGLMSLVIGKTRPDSATNGLIQILGSIVIIVVIFSAVLYVQQDQQEKNESILEPPLTYADMSIDLGDPDIRYSREEESIFGHKRYANMSYPDHEYLFYSLYTTEYDWVLDKLWEEETDGKANETRNYCTDAWGAVEAFRNGGGDYLVRYEDAIWVISPSLEEPLTQEQIELAIAAIRGE